MRNRNHIDVRQVEWETLPDIWDTLAQQVPEQVALVDEIHEPKAEITYGELKHMIDGLAGAMQGLGLQEGDCVSLFSENSHRWFACEQAAMRAGACNAVRGVAAPPDELLYIYENSRSVACVVETPQLLKKIYAEHGGLRAADGSAPKFIVVLYPGKAESGSAIAADAGVVGSPVLTFEELSALGKAPTPSHADRDSPATLVYTSGTTSRPKGVVLKHRNLLYQVYENSFHAENPTGPLNPEVGDTFVSILPCWHIFERTAEYWTMSRGVKLVYSNIRNFKADLVRYRPQFLVAVPRLFETIHNGVMDKFDQKGAAAKKLLAFFAAVARVYHGARRRAKGLVMSDRMPTHVERLFATLVAGLTLPLAKVGDLLVWSKVREGLGGRLKVMLSGGSSLAMHLEEFFSNANLRLLVGYGLTETSPVIASRVVEANLPGTVGKPPRGTVLKIVDPDSKRIVKPGEVGVVMAKGPQVMAGYQDNPEATEKAIDVNGFFDTGDLGRINPATGHLLITGRAKDTIVLSNGENVEPAPIEDAIIGGTDAVDQVMLVGQDQKFLSGVAVVNAKAAAEQGWISDQEAEEVRRILGATPMTTGITGGDAAEAFLAEVAAKLNSQPTVREAVVKACGVATKGKGFARWEGINDVILRVKPFTVPANEMTQTLKVKRDVVTRNHEEEIKRVYA